MSDPRFPPAAVLRSLTQSIANELERGGASTFIAVPDEMAHESPLMITASDLAQALGACGAEHRLEDLAVSLICCRPADAQPPCGTIDLPPPRGVIAQGTIQIISHGWHAATEAYAL